MGIAVKKNDISLLNALNKIIDDMKADGTLYTILVENGLNVSNIIKEPLPSQSMLFIKGNC